MMRKEKILLVDDDPTVRTVISHKLLKYFTVISANDGEDGL